MINTVNLDISFSINSNHSFTYYETKISYLKLSRKQINYDIQNKLIMIFKNLFLASLLMTLIKELK